jgi:hypothetical protein
MPEFNWKGEWLPDLPYIPNVVVIHNNINYISLNFVSATDVTPDVDTSNWAPILEIIEPL